MLARLNDEDDRPLSFLFGMLGLSTRFGFVSCLKENGCFCERSDRAGLSNWTASLNTLQLDSACRFNNTI